MHIELAEIPEKDDSSHRPSGTSQLQVKRTEPMLMRKAKELKNKEFILKLKYAYFAGNDLNKFIVYSKVSGVSYTYRGSFDCRLV